MSDTKQASSWVDAVVFDCDGTLSQLEGIDELARQNGVGSQVSRLTEEAMTTTGLNEALYRQRLELVQPALLPVIRLSELYYETRTSDIETVIRSLQVAGKEVFIVSAGINPAVKMFGAKLGIPEESIFAVNVSFSKEGEYLDFDHHSPLVHNHGKRILVERLRKQYPRLGYIGDGMNDFQVKDLVTRFVGFGGHFYRENIKNQCEYYIQEPSMMSLLPLMLTSAEFDFRMPGEM